jgi:hypothetical protein
MPKKTKTITIPRDLARLLVADPEDFKTRKAHDESKTVAVTMLKLLLSLDE